MKDKLRSFCRKHYIELVYSFGSRAIGLKKKIEGKEGLNDDVSSDFDIGIKMIRDKNISLKDKVKLEIGLEELFEINNVDLAILSEVDCFVAANIIRGERLFCCEETNADEYELFLLGQAGDLARFEYKRLQALMGNHV